MGLITTQLEQQVVEAARRHGVVVWYDPAGAFTSWTDDLLRRHSAGEFRYPVVRFRGSYLDLLTDLAGHLKGIDNQPLLVHLAGLTPDTVRPTPALAVAKAGHSLTLDLPGLVRQVAAGRVEQSELNTQLAGPGLTLAGIDTWLDRQVSVRRTGLEAELDRLTLPRLADELLASRDTFLGHPVDAAVTALVRAHARRVLGVTAEWQKWHSGAVQVTGDADVFAQEAESTFAWAMAVEYVHDLRRTPRLADLRPLLQVAAPLVENCRLVAAHGREHQADRYERAAVELEQRLGEERTGGRPQDLGDIDTFRFEAELLLRSAIEEVQAGRWRDPRRWCDGRVVQRSFWLTRNPRLGSAWELVNAAATLLEAIAATDPSLGGCATADEAAQAYADALWRVDQAHRRLLQRAGSVLEPQLPEYAGLRSALTATRKAWRVWADRLAQAFSKICRDSGFLPQLDRQQRTLFDEVVRPWAAAGKTALFLVDALRFEMAHDLLADLTANGGEAQLQVRLCELPSITSVGMNVLAPVAVDGTLQPSFANGKFGGFRAGEFTVHNLETRQRAMFMRVGGTRLPVMKLEEACDLPADNIRQKLRGASMTLVASREIDDAGEAGLGLGHFEEVLRRLKIACRNLQTAGVRRFIFTADHGFLLQDDTATVHRYGRTVDPDRRHVWSADGQEQGGLVSIPASALRYDGVSGSFLMPADTGVFDKGPGNRGNFVHGGNSLQERAIPVLTATFAGAEIPEITCQIEAFAGVQIAGLQTLKVRVLPLAKTGLALPFAELPRVEVMIRAPHDPDVVVELKGVRPDDRFDGARLRLPIDEAHTEVFFSLSGRFDARVQLEVFVVDTAMDVAPAVLEGLFAVAGTALDTEPLAKGAEAWIDAIIDSGHRKVARQLAQTGRVSENDLQMLLGSPRAGRSFALRLDEFKALLPFSIQIAVTDEGKVYQKG